MPLVVNPQFPALKIYQQSGLTFPWAEYNPQTEGSFDAHFGPEGAFVGMQMIIYWRDLNSAVQQLLGYSWRDTTSTTPLGNYWLRRKLPWQHPNWNQLWVKAITSVKGIRQEGTNFTADSSDQYTLSTNIGAGAGRGQPTNTGPWTDFHLAKLTIQFWRPPYAIRSDADILDVNNNPQEWLRYLDKNWSVNVQMLSREAGQFLWASAVNAIPGRKFHGSVGQKLSRLRVSRKWYQIPESVIFQTLSDASPNGTPYGLTYSQTVTTNPITGLSYNAASVMPGSLNVPIYANGVDVSHNSPSVITATGDLNTGSATVNITSGGDMRTLLGVSGAVAQPIAIGCTAGGLPANGIPIGTCVSSVAATAVTLTQASTATATGVTITFITDGFSSRRFLGCYMGTLLYEGYELEPVPLQMPAGLMQIPTFGANEAISQNQYNVTFHFELFDPTIPTTEYHRGHNCYPYSGNGLWYPARSQQDVNNPPGTAGKFATPFTYSDFSDLFRVPSTAGY